MRQFASRPGTTLPGGLAIGVRDTGCGIRPEDTEAVFENFGQARHDLAVREKGTGLGLMIVQRIVRDHGGRIDVESEVGRGTTFKIRLPRQKLVALELPPAGGADSGSTPRSS